MFIRFIQADKSQTLAIAGCHHGYARIQARMYLKMFDKFTIKCIYK
jgi:hypothetical protein